MRHGPPWRSTFKGDLLSRGGPKPKNGCTMVRFGSPDLQTSALGVKRVRGSVAPWSRDRPKPKKAPNCQNSKICPRSIFRRSICKIYFQEIYF